MQPFIVLHLIFLCIGVFFFIFIIFLSVKWLHQIFWHLFAVFCEAIIKIYLTNPFVFWFCIFHNLYFVIWILIFLIDHHLNFHHQFNLHLHLIIGMEFLHFQFLKFIVMVILRQFIPLPPSFKFNFKHLHFQFNYLQSRFSQSFLPPYLTLFFPYQIYL